MQRQKGVVKKVVGNAVYIESKDATYFTSSQVLREGDKVSFFVSGEQAINVLLEAYEEQQTQKQERYSGLVQEVVGNVSYIDVANGGTYFHPQNIKNRNEVSFTASGAEATNVQEESCSAN